jgi:hypothetical protein
LTASWRRLGGDIKQRCKISVTRTRRHSSKCRTLSRRGKVV